VPLAPPSRIDSQPEDKAITLDDALRSALDGDALLFVGAGLSFLSRGPSDRRIPDVDALIDLLLEQSPGTGSKHKLDRVAGSVARSKGTDFVYDIVRNNFIVEKVDPRLVTLYDMPWKRIYTTNYDNAPEVARLGKRPVSSVTLDNQQRDATLGSIIHLNGFVKNVSPNNIGSGLLLSDASYAASRLVDTGWLSFFEHDIRTSRAVIFAGYSLYDLDIEKVLLSAEGIRRKAFFFISPDADDIEISTLERYGVVVPGGIDTLVGRITTAKADYKPPQFVTGLTCLREINTTETEARPRTAARKVEDQLVYGVLAEQEVLTDEAAFDHQTYLVLREQDRAVREAFRLGPWRDALFTGEIASGKSASTLNITKYLRDSGYRVYYALKGSSLQSDLRRLSSLDEKIAVIFDGYSPFREEIAEYASRRPLNHRIILTERSGIHELISGFIEKTPHLGPVYEAALDKIAHQDIAGFEALTNFGGFWGDRAGSGVSARQGYISNQLDSSLYRLLLEIIKSQKVQNNIRELIEPISKDREAAIIFCSAMIVNALRFDFTLSEWQYWFDRNSVRRMATSYAEQVRHFMSIGSNHIYVRSGLLSLHVLHEFLDDELVRDCLVELYERAESSSDSTGKWKSLMIELMKFNAIESMFSGPTAREYVFSYYENIRTVGATRNNPDYWLQLGIASTVLDDLPRGEVCFKNAYSREKAKISPNLTKIDNYAARFEMKKAFAEADPTKAFEQFIAASIKLEKQIFLDNNRHYPFKTGRQFSEIAAKHFENWNEAQKDKFKTTVINIRNKAIEWKRSKNQHSVDVEILIKETGEILKKLNQ